MGLGSPASGAGSAMTTCRARPSVLVAVRAMVAEVAVMPPGLPQLDDAVAVAVEPGQPPGRGGLQPGHRHLAVPIGVPGGAVLAHPLLALRVMKGLERSGQRRVGQGCVSTCKSRWS